MISADSLSAVVVARRRQVGVRIGLAVAIVLIFQSLTGLAPALVWLVAYAVSQLLERFHFRRVVAGETLAGRDRATFLALIVVSNFIFGYFGVLQATHAGTWGLMCGVLLWSGVILNGTMVSANSGLAFSASIIPSTVYFIVSPAFVFGNGGGTIEAVSVVAAGVLVATAAVAIWKTSHDLIATAARERETAHLALRDPETGLPNRHSLQRLAAELRAIPDSGGMVLVVAISIDRFDHLYSAIGHAQLTELVGEMAARIALTNPRGVGRLEQRMLGAVWVVPDDAGPDGTAQELLDALEAPIVVRDSAIDVSVTVGMSDTETDRQATGLTIVDRAVVAVDQARRLRRPAALFDPELYGDPGSNLSLMSDMLQALASDEMDVHYQPKLDLRNGRITGVEALVRWTHPDKGPLRPDDFIQLAEETGRIAVLTTWVLERAVNDQRRLEEDGFPLNFSINLSGQLIDDEAFQATVLDIVRGAAGRITLEVTETAVMESFGLHPESGLPSSSRIEFSIDDFGTGLSSLAYLRHIPAAELKIDKTFVTDMASHPADRVLVSSAVGMAHGLGMRAVAEGVETEEALRLLTSMGCDVVQGYHIARPMPFDQLERFLRRWQVRSAHARDDEAAA